MTTAFEKPDLGRLIASQVPGRSLDQAFYLSPGVFAADTARIFHQDWHLAGHISELPEPGNYLLFDMLGESVIVVRGQDGALHAHANVCRHRGSRLCLEPRGSVKRFTCPYHAWSYEVDGQLFNARQLDAGEDRDALSLKPVAVELFEGLIYVSLSDQPASFAALREELTPHVRPFGMARTKIAHRRTYPVKANWKLLVENYNECYHCSGAHPEFSRSHSIHMTSDRVAPLNDDLQARAAAIGASAVTLDRSTTHAPDGSPDYSYNRYALFDGFQTGSEDGQPVAPLLGDLTGYDGGASDVYVGILNPMLVYCDHAVLYRFVPVDLHHSVQEIIWLVHEDAEEGRDYDLGRLTWLWDVTTEADKRIIEANQEGIGSRYYEPGPLVEMEQYTRRFLETYLARLA
ncbi:aromatic ring-hydroxylating oxygenase subunit alpha [Aestuariivita boseongensis]|uniref:aromatic ring-hydroxylating oxygenase subunit alpha n=1 Tax=Aestuariivita boseongensis TaxID=1470562 RepID=UPI000680A506|nr:aromatic ring-hydroxylating dioxygenase subunit alpha [Aestuariivita boseongensis]